MTNQRFNTLLLARLIHLMQQSISKSAEQVIQHLGSVGPGPTLIIAAMNCETWSGHTISMSACTHIENKCVLRNVSRNLRFLILQ